MNKELIIECAKSLGFRPSRSLEYPDSILMTLNQINDVMKLNPELIFAINSSDKVVDSIFQNSTPIKEKSFPSKSGWKCFK